MNNCSEKWQIAKCRELDLVRTHTTSVVCAARGHNRGCNYAPSKGRTLSKSRGSRRAPKCASALAEYYQSSWRRRLLGATIELLTRILHLSGDICTFATSHTCIIGIDLYIALGNCPLTIHCYITVKLWNYGLLKFYICTSKTVFEVTVQNWACRRFIKSIR